MMLFAVQMILTVIISLLVRTACISIYLSAKNDMISEMLKKEARALDPDNYNPSPAWCMDYWKAHYTELGSDIEAFEESLPEEEQDFLYDLSYELSEDETEARAYLDAMSDEEQLEYAKFQLSGFMTLFGRKTDYYGYEGCSCFLPMEDGSYLILVELDEDRISLHDSVYIEDAGDAKDRMMAQLRSHTYTDNDDAVVEYARLERADEDGKRHKLYVGFVPVVYDGEIKAVITLNYNYDLFVEKTDNMLMIALAVIIAVNLLVCLLFIYRTRKIATKPIGSIQGAVRDYMTTKNSGNARSALNQIHSDNEIGALADDVGEMIVTRTRKISRDSHAGNHE